MKLYHLWVIVTPEGGHCPFLIKPTRAECIANYEKWSEHKWRADDRRGYMCVKLSVRTA